MKIVLLVLILAAPYIVQAQSVFIESKKYYAPYKDEYRSDTAVFNMPELIGLSNDMTHKLSPYLSADSVLGDNIDSVVSNYKQNGAGVTGVSYRVLYNKNDVLSIAFTTETMGAYPDIYYTDVNLNLKTGGRILITDIIKKDKVKELVSKLDKIVQKRIKDKIKEEQIGDEDALQFFDDDKFTVESLANFAVKEGGIMFYYNFGLPRAVRALSPDEDIWMTNAELEEYYTAYGKALHK